MTSRTFDIHGDPGRRLPLAPAGNVLDGRALIQWVAGVPAHLTVTPAKWERDVLAHVQHVEPTYQEEPAA